MALQSNFFQLFIVHGMYNFGKGAKLTNQTAQGRKVNLWQRDQSQYVIQSIGLVSLTKQCAKVLNILFSINVISFGIFLLNWLWILLSKLEFEGSRSISDHDYILKKYTANVLTIKTTGTGNCGVPAGKICTIYRKGL